MTKNTLLKTISILITFAMLLAFLPGGFIVAHAESGTCGDNLTWTLEDSVLTISGAGRMIESDYPWKSKSFLSVIIEDGVMSIGDSAFFFCTGLTSVTIPNSVTSIGAMAFAYCTGLTSVTIPNSVTSIGGWAFEDCYCLTSVTIPNSVTNIGYCAFLNCIGLTSVMIGNGVTSIGDYAFMACIGLTNITVAVGNPVYHSAGNCIIETESRTLIAGCKNSVIPSDGSVTSIGDAAFRECTGLTSVTIPNSVTSIGWCAFHECTGLTSVTIGNGVTSIGEGAFHYLDWYADEYEPLDVTLRVYENSYAHRYAIDEGFKYELIKSAVTKGDPDGDGKITVGDALSALRVAARIVPATPELIATCDIDGDGKVTVGDALSILRVAARIVDSL